MQFGRLRFVLILALLASNLLVGVRSLFFLRSMNQRYTTLLERSVSPINGLRTLTRELSGWPAGWWTRRMKRGGRRS
jgi:hypothetical protein